MSAKDMKGYELEVVSALLLDILLSGYFVYILLCR